jgi:hypothetical protein
LYRAVNAIEWRRILRPIKLSDKTFEMPFRGEEEKEAKRGQKSDDKKTGQPPSLNCPDAADIASASGTEDPGSNTGRV